MSRPDVTGAIEYARGRMAKELAPDLCYHNLDHTFVDVLPAAMELAELLHVNGRDANLLTVAAAFHDIGWVVQGLNHERIGVNIARAVLPDYGFSKDDIEVIARIIMATRLPQSPTNLLEKILADADLAALGGDMFWERHRALREELAARGELYTDEEWLFYQLEFMKSHRYFTAAARSLRDSKKKRNQVEAEEMLASLQR
jgi:uncharacterized protein